MADAEEELAALVKVFTDEDGTDIIGEDAETPIGQFVYVEDQWDSPRRWFTRVWEIYKSPSGLLFAVPWDRGHTESQEHEFFPEQTFEVESYVVPVTKYRKKVGNG